MMVLRTVPASPFGRKVKIAAFQLGLKDRILVQSADTRDPSDTLRDQNPLGKIPVLLIEDGSALYDSRVIVEYLDMLAGGGRIIPVGLRRIDVLRRQALADGIMDAAVLQIYEARYRPEEIRSRDWTEHQGAKVARGLASFETDAVGLEGEPMIDEIALACVLGYLDLRFDGGWRKDYPRLVAWLDEFAAAVPAFALTTPTA
jgi:glutathione S-transferase